MGGLDLGSVAITLQDYLGRYWCGQRASCLGCARVVLIKLVTDIGTDSRSDGPMVAVAVEGWIYDEISTVKLCDCLGV